jgi:hypothetical protein
VQQKGFNSYWLANGIEKSEALEKEVDYLIGKYRLKDIVRPITLKTLSANPGNYIFYLYKILLELEKYDNNQRIAATQPQQEVSFPWVHSALKTLIEADMEKISKRKRNQLARGLKKIINDTQEKP